MVIPTPTSFLVRARRSEVTRLKKKVADLDKRMSDMASAKSMLLEQMAEHEAEIKKLGGVL